MGNIRESFVLNDKEMYYSSIYVENTCICGLDACAWGIENAMFTGTKYAKVMTINRVKVHTNIRGKGVGKALLSKVCEFADKNGIVLELGVSPDLSLNSLDYEGLVKLYEKFGFKLVEDLPSIMVRELK